MRTLPLAVLLLTLTGPSWALDWGGTLETSTSAKVTGNALGAPVMGSTEAAGLWFLQPLGPAASLFLKASVTGTQTLTWAPRSFEGVADVDLDTLLFSAQGWKVGRTAFRDFSSTLLNTVLDGVQWDVSWSGLGLRTAIGTSALVFQDQSTVVISQADINDRTAGRDWSQPSTYLAPARAVGYVEATLPRIVFGQNLTASVVGQYDLRSKGMAKAGQVYDPKDTSTAGAPVSMVYTGLGSSGQLWGPLQWSLWAYGGWGKTLTLVSKSDSKNKSKTPTSVWKDATIVNGIADIDLTLLIPEWSSLLVSIGAQVGSWDPDGTSPSQNLPDGGSPSFYTGYLGVSRTTGALVFTPQPTNMVVGQGLVSFKPSGKGTGAGDGFQVVTIGWVFVRPSTGPIAESGLDARSSDRYLGAEGDLSLLFRPASDWGGSLSCGVFVPGAALNRPIEGRVQAGLNLSF